MLIPFFPVLPRSIQPWRKATVVRSGRVEPLPRSVTFKHLGVNDIYSQSCQVKKATLNISIAGHNLANKGCTRLYLQRHLLWWGFFISYWNFLTAAILPCIKVEFNPIENQVTSINVYQNFTAKANSHKQMCIMGRMLIILCSY